MAGFSSWPPCFHSIEPRSTGGARRQWPANTKQLFVHGWRSDARATPGSASVVTYIESWSVERAGSLPVFRLQATLGSARTESLEGVTLYTSTALDSSGDLVRGTFERDETRHGSFRMLRAGPVTGLGKNAERRTDPLRQQLFERYLAAEEAEEGAKESGEAALE